MKKKWGRECDNDKGNISVIIFHDKRNISVIIFHTDMPLG
jgi:hypothetical protein